MNFLASCVRLLSILILFSIHSLVAGGAASSFLIENPQIDFGSLSVHQVSQQKKLDGTFKIKNTSNKPLKIEKISASCGCTSSTPDKTEVKPGKTINLNIAINLEGKSGNNQVQVVVLFTNGETASLKALYDVQIDAALFPLELHLYKKKGESAQGTITAYYSFPTPIAKEKLPKIELFCKNPQITFRRKEVRIGKTPNELNGHYYCSIDFEVTISPEVYELVSSAVLKQEGDPIRSIPIIVTEKKEISLRRSAFLFSDIKQGDKTPVRLEIEGLCSFQKPSVTMEGLVEGALKSTMNGSTEIVDFDLRWDKAGLSCLQGVIQLEGSVKMPFSCMANVGTLQSK